MAGSTGPGLCRFLWFRGLFGSGFWCAIDQIPRVSRLHITDDALALGILLLTPLRLGCIASGAANQQN